MLTPDDYSPEQREAHARLASIASAITPAQVERAWIWLAMIEVATACAFARMLLPRLTVIMDRRVQKARARVLERVAIAIRGQIITSREFADPVRALETYDRNREDFEKAIGEP